MLIIIMVAMIFFHLFNLMVLAALWLSYRTSAREYLKIGCCRRGTNDAAISSDLADYLGRTY
jgi:hypothetical protein